MKKGKESNLRERDYSGTPCMVLHIGGITNNLKLGLV